MSRAAQTAALMAAVIASQPVGSLCPNCLFGSINEDNECDHCDYYHEDDDEPAMCGMCGASLGAGGIANGDTACGRCA